MTDDIVARLRQAHAHSAILRGSALTCKEAADEIERLRLEAKQASSAWAEDCRAKEKAEAERDALRAENARWQELHRVIALELGTEQDTWPDHGNAPLAIAATFMLHRQAAEKAEAERDALRQDAERYRWLHSKASWPWVRDHLWQPLSVAEFDAAIDAAMKEKP